MVDGSAFVVDIFGRVSRWFQNGDVQRYMAAFAIGGALVFFIADCHHRRRSTTRWSATRSSSMPTPAAGILGSAAHVHCDFDGDGQPDSDPTRPGELLDKRDVTVTGYDGPITMWVEDSITRREPRSPAAST